MFGFKKEKMVNEKTLQWLLESPAAQALLSEQQRLEDEAALARRLPIIDRIHQLERQLQATRDEDSELATQEAALRKQLQAVVGARHRISAKGPHIGGQIAQAERELRQKHGEAHRIEAECICSSVRMQLQGERERLRQVAPMVRDPAAHPEDWTARHIANPDRMKAGKRISAIDSQVAKIAEGVKSLAELRHANLAPRELERRCAKILKGADVVKPIRPQWEGDTVGDGAKYPAHALYTLPSVAKQIVSAAQ